MPAKLSIRTAAEVAATEAADQSNARQLDGFALDRTFEDKASGKDTKRPQLEAAL